MEQVQVGLLLWWIPGAEGQLWLFEMPKITAVVAKHHVLEVQQ